MKEVVIGDGWTIVEDRPLTEAQALVLVRGMGLGHIVDFYEKNRLSNKGTGWIAITAAEGGVNYWATSDVAHPYEWERWQPEGPESEWPEIDDEFVFYGLRQTEDTDSPVILVTPSLIRRGIARFRGGTDKGLRGVAFQAREFYDPQDLEAMDADEADCVIQLGAFGELVYG